jgi:hypothetical protein
MFSKTQPTDGRYSVVRLAQLDNRLGDQAITKKLEETLNERDASGWDFVRTIDAAKALLVVFERKPHQESHQER